jgi:hypothetical protein
MSMAESGGTLLRTIGNFSRAKPAKSSNMSTSKDDTNTIIEKRLVAEHTSTNNTHQLDHVLTSNPLAAPHSPRGPQPRLRMRAHRLQHLLGQLAHLENVANVARQTRRIAHKEPGCFPTNKRNEGPKFRQEAV